jgi:hypothetical protein
MIGTYEISAKLVVEGTFPKQGGSAGETITDPEILIQPGDSIVYNPVQSKTALVEKNDGTRYAGVLTACVVLKRADDPPEATKDYSRIQIGTNIGELCCILAGALGLSIRLERTLRDGDPQRIFRYTFVPKDENASTVPQPHSYVSRKTL